MADSMTLEEVKQRKMDLELELVKLFKNFEKGTELKIGYVDVMRKPIKEKNSGKSTKDVDALYQPHRGPVTDVNINVDLDLVY